METFANIVAKIDSFIWGAPLLILLVAVHVYLTFRLKFIQRFIPLGIKLSVTKDPDGKGDISQFGALSIAL
ncbi:MAG: sodium:alanine symporter family protein, partial [Lentisphaeria bacterium]|nr:sodium:alanine symporter family protein [Lentisphaeria bacterium]